MPDYWLDHIHLMSPDPVKTAGFYEKMFGATLVTARDEGDGKAMAKLDLKGITLLISQRTGDDAKLGLDHFGIETDKLEEAVAAMKADGVEFTQDIREVRPGFSISFLNAPEGVSIELQEGSL
ncbi:VOC family protein [Chloroflexota bacterium]